MADVQRTGGVHAHELHDHALGRLGLAAAVGVPGLDRAGERVAAPGVGHEQVEEARPGHVHALDLAGKALLHQAAEALGHGARRLAQGGRQQQGRVG